MTFTIESDDEDDDILTPLGNNNSEPTPPTPIDMNIVLNAFPDDHFLPESSCLLGERIVGTAGFCGALALLSATCCCFCSGLHRQELANTHNRFTLCGLCCPFDSSS